jgi:hypothetical protein
MRVERLGLLHGVEQVSVELERGSEVVQRLLVVLLVQITLAQVRVGLDQDEWAAVMHVYQHFAKRQLVDAHLDNTFFVADFFAVFHVFTQHAVLVLKLTTDTVSDAQRIVFHLNS